MNVLKNMEAIFLAALIVVSGSSYAVAATEKASDSYAAQVSVGMAKVAVVKVSAAR
ncbi:hypothetical protein [Massilia sp. DD77]|uniref:hypothetical protein n=1 Tax=Massilia sp. DD77 TaxID=3109349 RepID=UPI002FFE5763